MHLGQDLRSTPQARMHWVCQQDLPTRLAPECFMAVGRLVLAPWARRCPPWPSPSTRLIAKHLQAPRDAGSAWRNSQLNQVLEAPAPRRPPCQGPHTLGLCTRGCCGWWGHPFFRGFLGPVGPGSWPCTITWEMLQSGPIAELLSTSTCSTCRALELGTCVCPCNVDHSCIVSLKFLPHARHRSQLFCKLTSSRLCRSWPSCHCFSGFSFGCSRHQSFQPPRPQ